MIKRKCADGVVKVRADLHEHVADMCLRRLSRAPLLQKFLEAFGGEEETADRARHIGVVSLSEDGDDGALWVD